MPLAVQALVPGPAALSAHHWYNAAGRRLNELSGQAAEPFQYGIQPQPLNGESAPPEGRDIVIKFNSICFSERSEAKQSKASYIGLCGSRISSDGSGLCSCLELQCARITQDGSQDRSSRVPDL